MEVSTEVYVASMHLLIPFCLVYFPLVFVGMWMDDRLKAQAMAQALK